MTNFTVNLAYYLLALVLIVMLGVLIKNRQKRLIINLIFLTVSILCWTICLILYNSTTDVASAYRLYDAELPFVALTSMGVLLLMLRFYDLGNYLIAPLVAAMCVIPIITFILILTYTEHDFLRQNLVIVSLAPLHEATSTRGAWFFVHAFYGYSLIFSAICVALSQHSRIPKNLRGPSNILIVGIFATAVGNIIVLSGASPMSLDFSLFCASISTIVIYKATLTSRGIYFLNKARSEIFNQLKSAVLILNDEGLVTGYNNVAETEFSKINVGLKNNNYDTIMKKLKNNAIRIAAASDDDGSIDYEFRRKNGTKRIISINEKKVFDKKAYQIGTIVVLTSVTENRAVIEKLEIDVGVDPLTGLANHREMEKCKIEFDKPKYLPLAIMAGDVNFLKKVNDDYGHQQGDVLLRSAASVLLSACPPNARIGRVGGDEFLVLIPNFTKDQCDMLLENIRSTMNGVNRHPYKVSIALGYTVKEVLEEDLTVLSRIADEKMYDDKKQSRRD